MPGEDGWLVTAEFMSILHKHFQTIPPNSRVRSQIKERPVYLLGDAAQRIAVLPLSALFSFWLFSTLPGFVFL